MLRSLYIAGTGMMTQRAKMNVVINNITNVDTAGYKKDVVVTRSFEDMLLDRLNDPSILNQRRVGPLAPGVHVDEKVTDFKQGPIEITDVDTDMAITGDGFFVVRTPQGNVQYTRAGNFITDPAGNLLTQEGYAVLGQGGAPINVGTGGFTVRQNGAIFGAEGQQLGMLQIVQFTDNGILRKAGDNCYVPYNGEQPQAAQNYAIEQGMLEGSNLDTAREVAEMMLTQRVYESSQRMLQMVDESLEKTVNQIAQF